MGDVVAILGWTLFGATLVPLGVLGWTAWRRSRAAGSGTVLPAAKVVAEHFAPLPVADLTISTREFPYRVRGDLQRAMETLLASGMRVHRFAGLAQEYSHVGFTLHTCMVAGRGDPVRVAAPEYEDLDVGEEAPLRCLKTGLWLLEDGTDRLALLLTPALVHGQAGGIRCEIATPAGAAGFERAQRVFRALETAVAQARTYRGKILSLEGTGHHYMGASIGIRVHRLKPVARDEVILPPATLSLLERNVIGFVARRPALAAAGQPTKKGLLFYGPPGTGKTHTIHYLAGALEGQTTLLVTAEQIGLLAEYMELARLLQPSIVVIEDVDLVATSREELGLCEESVLNGLLNEMDGLRPDAEILFLLTTNRPESLERALASRPGRVDQAIEFPLPDLEGRAKLIRLYARSASLAEGFVETLARRIDRVSAAFVKELLRRSVQFRLERGRDGPVEVADAEAAIDEMLFRGGTLNASLLGATGLREGAPPGD